MRRGQPEAAKHWCFNRHLNAVNLALGNGEACLLEISTVPGIESHKRLRGIFEER